MLTTAQDNRYTAYDTLHQELTVDSTPYQNDEALKEIVDELGTGLTDIQQLRKKKTRPSSGPSEEKTKAKQFLADVAAEVAGDLFSWGAKTKNLTLQAETNYNASVLFDLRGTRIYDITGQILQQARDQKTAMAKYAISDDRTQELEDARTAYDGFRSGPRRQQTQGIAISTTIGQKFSDLSTLIEDRFERSIRKYKRLNRDFYDRVMAAREVIDRPGTHDSPTPPSPAA